MVNNPQKKSLLRMIWIIIFIIAIILLYFAFRPNPINFQIIPISPYQSSAFIRLSSGLMNP